MSTPYEDSDSVPQGLSGRTQEFNTGISGTGEVASSLDADSERINSEVPHSFTANSVLQQFRPSTNGRGPNAESRQLLDGSFLPSPNGTSDDSYERSTPLYLNGENA